MIAHLNSARHITGKFHETPLNNIFKAVLVPKCTFSRYDTILNFDTFLFLFSSLTNSNSIKNLNLKTVFKEKEVCYVPIKRDDVVLI